MDSITHITLGAVIGEVMMGKQLGKKAMLWGAVAQSAPDADFIASLFLDPSANLLAHRGFTHSILCCLVLATAFSLLAYRHYASKNISLRRWQLFLLLQLFIHIFIDAFNNYGVGWLEPFSHTRVSFNTLYVIDPFFSIAPVIASLILLKRRSNTPRTFLPHITIALSFIYLMYCTLNKFRIDISTKEILKAQGISQDRYFTTPTPLNNWLWYIVAQTDSGYYAGYRSVFDSRRNIHFEFFPQNRHLANLAPGGKDINRLTRFSQGYYTLESWHDTLVFNDLRFGQVTGWEHPRGKFAFHFYLNYNDNRMVVQRGRFAEWDRHAIISLLQRIRGN